VADRFAPMLARAVERLLPGAPVKFVRADPTTYRFELPLSIYFFRFGVMFFAEPARAFANLRTALKPSDAAPSPVGASSMKIPGFNCRCAPRLNVFGARRKSPIGCSA
jgi:hypothetical protein